MQCLHVNIMVIYANFWIGTQQNLIRVPYSRSYTYGFIVPISEFLPYLKVDSKPTLFGIELRLTHLTSYLCGLSICIKTNSSTLTLYVHHWNIFVFPFRQTLSKMRSFHSTPLLLWLLLVQVNPTMRPKFYSDARQVCSVSQCTHSTLCDNSWVVLSRPKNHYHCPISPVKKNLLYNKFYMGSTYLMIQVFMAYR